MVSDPPCLSAHLSGGWTTTCAFTTPVEAVSLSIVLRVPRHRCLMPGHDSIGCHRRPIIIGPRISPLDPEVIEQDYGILLNTPTLKGAA